MSFPAARFLWSSLFGHIFFFNCIYSRLFWKDLEFYINRKIECMIEICIFDVLFYTENENLNRKEQHILHLFILLGKFHIHKNKWAQCKPNFAHFINDFKLYVNLLKKQQHWKHVTLWKHWNVFNYMCKVIVKNTIQFCDICVLDGHSFNSWLSGS